MEIYGIGSNSFLNYTNSVNQMKLKQSLSNPSTNYAGKKEDDTYNRTSEIGDSMKFLKSYNNDMTELKSSANKLRDNNPSSVWNKVAVSSSDTNVLTAKENYNAKNSIGESLEVNVRQLAVSQSNTSSEFIAANKASKDVALDITFSEKTTSIDVSKLNSNGVEKTNRQLLDDTAKEINSKNIGISASVIESEGKINLKLSGGNNTGEKNSFSVSGDFASSANLSKVTQTAENAEYSVKSKDGTTKEFSSDDNDVSLEYDKISATLKTTGTSTISVTTDNKSVVSAVSDLVKDYNSTLELLDDNLERGTSVYRQFSSIKSGLASEKAMSLMGIIKNNDGTLSLDENQLQKSLQRDPNLTKDIISGSSGIAQKAYQKADSGLQVESKNLINNDVSNIALEDFFDPINTMNMYSRTGAYNMMNYSAIGVMLNMYA